jgi:predicted nucleotidyltransferase component of viral defense system
MTRKTLVNVAASVRARLLKVSKERRDDFTLTLMNYAAERFLYRLAQSKYRDRFILKGAMLLAVRVGERYRPTSDLDLLGLGEASEAAVAAAIRDIAATRVVDDGLVFDVDCLEVRAIREGNTYGGIRAVMQARLAEARIHVQIDVGFGDAITPAATDLQFPTLLADMPSPNVLAYPTETIVAEKVEAMVHLGLSNSRMKDFTDLAIAACGSSSRWRSSSKNCGSSFPGRSNMPGPASPSQPDGRPMATGNEAGANESGRRSGNCRRFESAPDGARPRSGERQRTKP